MMEDDVILQHSFGVVVLYRSLYSFGSISLLLLFWEMYIFRVEREIQNKQRTKEAYILCYMNMQAQFFCVCVSWGAYNTTSVQVRFFLQCKQHTLLLLFFHWVHFSLHKLSPRITFSCRLRKCVHTCFMYSFVTVTKMKTSSQSHALSKIHFPFLSLKNTEHFYFHPFFSLFLFYFTSWNKTLLVQQVSNPVLLVIGNFYYNFVNNSKAREIGEAERRPNLKLH